MSSSIRHNKLLCAAINGHRREPGTRQPGSENINHISSRKSGEFCSGASINLPRLKHLMLPIATNVQLAGGRFSPFQPYPNAHLLLVRRLRRWRCIGKSDHFSVNSCGRGATVFMALPNGNNYFNDSS